MNISEYFDHHLKKQDKEHFKNLLRVAMADGIIDQKESEALRRIGRKMDFTDSEIDNLIESTRNSSYNPPYELSLRFEQMYDIMKMVLADGVIETNEMRLANCFASQSGFNESEIPGLLALIIEGIKEGKDAEDLFIAYKKKKS